MTAETIPQIAPVVDMFDRPDQDLLEHSEQIADAVRNAVREKGGWIGFDEYMQAVLYTPGLGYYSAGTVKLGADGDYITAPMLGCQFAHCLAVQCAEILENLDPDHERILVEFGAGTGVMAADILEFLGRMDALPDRYVIVETSADLKERQQSELRRRGFSAGGKVAWADVPPAGVNGVVLANEVLDAIPFKRFRIERNGVPRELGVGLADGHLCWAASDVPLHRAVSDRIAALGLPAGYQGEVGVLAESWVAAAVGMLRCGVLLQIDYGFSRSEYYHWDRADGTLMCHHRHRSHTDPFHLPGLQDITAHVEFSAMAEAGKRAGADVAGYSTLGSFLISLGLLDRNMAVLADSDPTVESLQRSQELKKLTLPHEMGELFKVLALTRNYARPLSGFAMRNKRCRL